MMVGAMSLASPRRPSAVRSATPASHGEPSTLAAGPRPSMGVRVTPGATALTRMPSAPHSAAATWTSMDKAAFDAQLAMARRLGCAVVIHSRGAFGECVAAIDASGVDWTKVVFHCFAEGDAEMNILTGRGGRGSFTGILTYKNAEAVRAAARAQGLSRLMIETDAPFLAPVPHRGKTNEPAFLRHTAQYAANLLGVSLDELAGVTTANARAFYGF